MSVEQIMILVLVCVLIVLAAGISATCAYMTLRANASLMWFHTAGRSLAEHELEKARLSVREKEAEVQRVIAETEGQRVEIAKRRQFSPTGGARMPLTADGV